MPNCTTATSLSSCTGLTSSTCSKKYTIVNGVAEQCRWTGSVCVSDASDACNPPCQDSSGGVRLSTSFCQGKAQSICGSYNNVVTKNICFWDGSKCTEGQKCTMNISNCPTATQAIGSCSTATTSTCASMFQWAEGVAKQCVVVGGGCTLTSSSVCNPPCLPPGRNPQACPGLSQADCITKSGIDTDSSALCAWNPGTNQCEKNLPCYVPNCSGTLQVQPSDADTGCQTYNTPAYVPICSISYQSIRAEHFSRQCSWDFVNVICVADSSNNGICTPPCSARSGVSSCAGFGYNDCLTKWNTVTNRLCHKDDTGACVDDLPCHA